MKQPISKSGAYAAANRTIKTRKPEVVALMRKYGMSVSETDSEGKIDKAFFALLPRSRGFRDDFSQLATQVASDMTVGELSMTGYLNISGRGLDITKQTETLLPPKSITIPERKTTTSTTQSPKDFKSTKLGQILSNDTIKNVLNLGFSTLAYKATKGGVGGSTTSDNILGSAIVTPTPTPTQPPPVTGGDKKDEPKGADLGWLLFVGIGVVVVGAGFLIYKSVKK